MTVPTPNVSNAPVPRTAMVLAAGYGRRMQPLTAIRPKPLIEVMGRPLIVRILAHLAEAGVARVVVNTHYLAEKLHARLAGCQAPAVELVHEAEGLLDTGGGVANALDRLGERPFYVLNGDVFWLDGYTPALARLAAAWDDTRMDALLLMAPTAWAIGYTGEGDFQLDIAGRARRRRELEVAPFAFTGIQILHPRLFADAPAGAFSLNRLYDQAAAAGRLYGLVHDGLWFHIGTPGDLDLAEAVLEDMGFRHETLSGDAAAATPGPEDARASP